MSVSIIDMNKAFVKDAGDDNALPLLPEMPTGVRNYITPAGHRRLQSELSQLIDSARPDVAQREDRDSGTDPLPTDQAERALREIEQRIRYLQARLETAEIVDPGVHAGGDQVFFGATVIYRNERGEQHSVTIVGLDELDPANGKISWLSPVAQTLLKAHVGDSVLLDSPAGAEKLHILAVHYPQPQE